MTENNKWVKTAIIIVAVVVILESVVIIGQRIPSLNKSGAKAEPTKVLNEKKTPVAGLSVKSDVTEMKQKSSYKVWVELAALKNISLDAIDLYVSYDKSAFTVSKLDFTTFPVKPSFSKISDTKSVIVANYFITEPKGYVLKTSEISNLVSFTVTPKKAGNFEFGISLGDETGLSKTMLVENSTSKELPFDVQKLKIVVR